MSLADHLTVVLDRHDVPARARTRLIAAVAAAVDPPRTRALLLAHHPRGAAFLAAFDGHVRLHRDVLLVAPAPLPPRISLEPGEPQPGLTRVRTCWERESYQLVFRHGPLAGRRPLHAVDAPVTAGEPLTDGPHDLHDILTIFGERALCERLADELTAAIGTRPDDLHLLIEPMLAIVEVLRPGASGRVAGERLTRPAFEAALAATLRATLRDLAASHPLPAPLEALLSCSPTDAYDRWSTPDLTALWESFVAAHDLPRWPDLPVARATWTGLDRLAAHRDPPLL